MQTSTGGIVYLGFNVNRETFAGFKFNFQKLRILIFIILWFMHVI